jgi:hypothetical protein
VFFLRVREETGESMFAWGHLCGFAHTSIMKVFERLVKRGMGAINLQKLPTSPINSFVIRRP